MVNKSTVGSGNWCSWVVLGYHILAPTIFNWNYVEIDSIWTVAWWCVLNNWLIEINLNWIWTQRIRCFLKIDLIIFETELYVSTWILKSECRHFKLTCTSLSIGAIWHLGLIRIVISKCNIHQKIKRSNIVWVIRFYLKCFSWIIICEPTMRRITPIATNCIWCIHLPLEESNY